MKILVQKTCNNELLKKCFCLFDSVLQGHILVASFADYGLAFVYLYFILSPGLIFLLLE